MSKLGLEKLVALDCLAERDICRAFAGGSILAKTVMYFRLSTRGLTEDDCTAVSKLLLTWLTVKTGGIKGWLPALLDNTPLLNTSLTSKLNTAGT